MQGETAFLTLTPLGGMGEIGLNCQLWETPQGIVMVDCGLMFPGDEHLGIDVVIPDFHAVLAVRDRLCGIVLTHGHEDHIGALPWVVPQLKGIRLFGSRFTLALVERKLSEHGVLDFVDLVPVGPSDVLSLAGLNIHFFPVCHSIPEGYALGVESAVGRIVHSGDFKIEDQPLYGTGTDLSLFSHFAGDGVRLLLADSTNIQRDGHSLSEREVRDSLGRVFAEAQGRIVITLFSSHIHRIQEVFDLSREYGRTVVISGKSLATNIQIARELGIAHLPPNFFDAHNGVPDLPDEQLVIIVTGAQGEPLSALSRMVFGGHKQLSIHAGDTVLMSSRIIPGNGRAITRMINAMYRLGAEVLYESVHAIHASGHAHRQELESLLQAVRPEFFVPIHGEYQHLVKHAQMATRYGIDEKKVIILEDGLPLTLFPESFQLEPALTLESTLVDGKGVGDVERAVLRERRILGDEGMVIMVLVLERASGKMLYGPELLSKGFVFEPEYSYVLEDAKCIVLDELEKADLEELQALQESIRSALRRFFRRVLDRDPIVLAIVSAV